MCNPPRSSNTGKTWGKIIKISSLSTEPSESIPLISSQSCLISQLQWKEPFNKPQSSGPEEATQVFCFPANAAIDKQHHFQLPYKKARCSAAWWTSSECCIHVHFKKSLTNMCHCTIWHLGVSFRFSAFLLSKKWFILVTLMLPSPGFWFYPCLSFTRLPQTLLHPFNFNYKVNNWLWC